MNKKISTGVGIAIVAAVGLAVAAVVWFGREPQVQMQVAQPIQNVQKESLKGHVGNQNENQKADQAASKTEATSNWKTYTTQEFKFSIKYPNNWFIFDKNKNEILEKMCRTQFEIDSPMNKFSDSKPCIPINLNFLSVVRFNSINGYCTKGGCVGTDLKKINNISNVMSVGIAKVSPAEKIKMINTYIAKPNFKKSKIGIADVYSIPGEENDGIPKVFAFFEVKGNLFMIGMATETGAEKEEIEIINKMLTTLILI